MFRQQVDIELSCLWIDCGVLPSLYCWARCSAAFSAATAADPQAAKLPLLTRAMAAPKRKCPIA